MAEAALSEGHKDLLLLKAAVPRDNSLTYLNKGVCNRTSSKAELMTYETHFRKPEMRSLCLPPEGKADCSGKTKACIVENK